MTDGKSAGLSWWHYHCQTVAGLLMWVCRLQLLLALASAAILGSESRRTHDNILLSQI
jgi:hypothetical protein